MVFGMFDQPSGWDDCSASVAQVRLNESFRYLITLVGERQSEVTVLAEWEVLLKQQHLGGHVNAPMIAARFLSWSMCV